MAYDTQLFTNNAVSLLSAAIAPSSTSLTVMAGHGAMFPQPTGDGSDYFLVTLENQTATVREIIRVNARVGDTFTVILRGQEGTTPQAWGASVGNDTLVDHRVTAETMRLAMLLPEATPIPPATEILVQKDSVQVGTAAGTLNFAGAGVSVSGAGSTKTITISGGSGGSSIINGENTIAPVNIDPGWTIATSTASYSQYQRGFKFFVTLYMPANHRSCTFEVLGNISGDLGTNSETATWNRTARVGYNFAGSVQVALNTTTKELELTWKNDEALPVEVMCTRIQHLP